MSREGALWIGGLERYMKEDFLMNALQLVGEDSVVSVKIIKNKFTGEPASYGFIHFDSDAAALMAMHKLNGKIIPHSQPPVTFQLNHASAKQSGAAYSEREYSIWVSDLPSDITEDDFRKAFATRYDSIKTVKVVRERDNKIFGFVRFTDLNDQRDSLIHMNGFLGLGEKPIRVSLAIPKASLSEAMTNETSNSYSHMYESYWNDKRAWANYGAFQGSTGAQQMHQRPENPVLVSNATTASVTSWDVDGDEEEQDEYILVEHSLPINVDAMNTECIARGEEVWDAVEKDRWIYNLDNEEGIAPNFRKGWKPKTE